MQNTRDTQYEFGYFDFELFAIIGLHQIAAAHGTHLRRQHGAAGIFETLARLKQGLLTHHALSAYLLHMVKRIGNDPVTADEFGGGMAEIGNGDRVRKNETTACFIGLLRQVIHFRLYDDAMLINCFHARHLNRFLLVSQGLRHVFMLIFARIFQPG
jgi:hypothetical protein